MYITVVAGLIFLTVAYFAFGQAAVSRNEVQGAADAAALAAAHDARDQLGLTLNEGIADPESWGDLLNGQAYSISEVCEAAQRFAANNGADAQRCEQSAESELRFTVKVRAREPVGDSVVPGTSGTHATATATAELQSRCDFDLVYPGDGADTDPAPIELDCDGEDVVVDPSIDDPLPRLDILFTVRLVE
ncbi:pilus assembly protein TadG-related protein [Streptomyces sp. WMMC897]|uniref:pilus assembly protein TadG-related protein n=1 Tax=Streptomyces sp. WMMC897 TaxID=3014782 RepID=UPI0022B6B11C|nr:pilus assembly protein TadG-related protein [Streptomyces sp. WMMC897]MCZ7416785.1 pilus assembly protein TadG-related protein [Streptomyces sp. WMMC897]